MKKYSYYQLHFMEFKFHIFLCCFSFFFTFLINYFFIYQCFFFITKCFFFFEKMNYFIFSNITELFWMKIYISLIFSFFFQLPFWFFQFFLFFSSGLYKKENILLLSILIFIIFFLFFSFWFYINFFLPNFWKFFIENENNIYSYLFPIYYEPQFYQTLNHLFQLFLLFIFFFQYPIFFFFVLLKIKIKRLTLIFFRKIFYFKILILAAIISPPDCFSQILLSLPIFLFFEIFLYTSFLKFQYKLIFNVEIFEKM